MVVNCDPRLTLLTSKEGEFQSMSDNDSLFFDGTNHVNCITDKKHKHRHTPHQIKELESFFQSSPHPDEMERLALSRKLNLTSWQIKCWFQNRRTNMKAQLERRETSILKLNYSNLIEEYYALKNSVQNPICGNCGGTAVLGKPCNQDIKILNENARLKDELSRIYALMDTFSSTPVYPPIERGFPCSPLDPQFQDELKRSIWVDHGLNAVQELMCLAHPDSSFWVKRLDGGGEVMNFNEYRKSFVPPQILRPKPVGFTSESSKETGMVGITSEVLAGILMDVEQWCKFFPSVVARAEVLEVISGGIGGTNNGALKLIEADLQILSPLVGVRHVMFLRFCKQEAEGLWVVVDVSFDSPGDNSSLNCRRLPSGCVMQDAHAGGYSKVTWVEHSEYDECLIHELFRPFISSGCGFGARRWLATLQRQCGCIAALLTPPPPGSGISLSGRKDMLHLTQRMVSNFCAGLCASALGGWEHVDSKNIGVNLKMKSMEGVGLVLNASTSIWIGVPHQKLIEFLRDNGSRGEWDILAEGAPLQEVLSFPIGMEQTNFVSLLRATTIETDRNEDSMMTLQETWTDASCSLIVHAPIRSSEMSMPTDKNTRRTSLLPSGFVIVPDGRPTNSDQGICGGSLLSIGFQVVANTAPMSKLSSESIQNVADRIHLTLLKIKEKTAALSTPN